MLAQRTLDGLTRTRGTSWARLAGADRRWLFALLITGVLAFVAQGTRGLWEPDEGFYANVAWHMATTGDWLTPQLNGQPFLDKPPLHFWGMALGLRMASGEWALRLAHSLWFLGTAFLVGLLASRLWGRRYGPGATVVYATMLMPFLAANILTPDTVLSFFVVAMAYAYWRWFAALTASERLRWSWLCGCAAGLGVLAKGPALLVFALPLVLHGLISKSRARFRWWELGAAAAMAALVGGSWYLYIVLTVPGALGYLFDNQVAGRLWSESYGRNSEWFGPLKIYVPVLIAGSLPWTFGLGRAIAAGWRGLRDAGIRQLRARPEPLLIGLWLVVPILVLCAASSRLPLYALPLMPAMALASARVLGREDGEGGWWIRPRALTFWLVLLVSLKLAAGLVPTDRSSASLAAGLRQSGVSSTTQLVVVDTKLNGLPVYGYTNLRAARFRNKPYPFFSPPASLSEVVHSSAGGEGRLYLAEERRADDLLGFLDSEVGPCRVRDRMSKTVLIECGGQQQASSPPLVDHGPGRLRP